MNIVKRACANCAAFNPLAVGDEPSCWNFVAMIDHAGTDQERKRQPGPSDRCKDHMTLEESAEMTALIDAHRDVAFIRARHEYRPPQVIGHAGRHGVA